MPELGKSGSVGALGGQPPKATRPPLFFGTALTGGYRFMTSFPMALAVLFRSPLDLKPRCDGLRNFSALASLRNLQPSGSLSLSGSRLFSRSRRKAAIPAALHMGGSSSSALPDPIFASPYHAMISMILRRSRPLGKLLTPYQARRYVEKTKMRRESLFRILQKRPQVGKMVSQPSSGQQLARVALATAFAVRTR